MRSYRAEDIYESVTGLQYQALKYLVVSATVYIEIGWINRSDAESLHHNEYQLERQENQIKLMIENEVGRMTREMKVFTRSIGRKAQEIVRETVYRPFFAVWKRNCHLPTLLSTSKKEHDTPSRSYIVSDDRYG